MAYYNEVEISIPNNTTDPELEVKRHCLVCFLKPRRWNGIQHERQKRSSAQVATGLRFWIAAGRISGALLFSNYWKICFSWRILIEKCFLAGTRFSWLTMACVVTKNVFQTRKINGERVETLKSWKVKLRVETLVDNKGHITIACIQVSWLSRKKILLSDLD